MKQIKTIIWIAIPVVLCLFSTASTAQDATEIIKKADQKWNGEKSSRGQMTMTIVRPEWKRTIVFKVWTLGDAYSMTLITKPAKEAGQTFLKREKEMWNWMPSIGRMIKLPPSMMGDGWMGSDYTNDDILKESSMVTDFVHTIIKEETIDEIPCWVIEMKPKEDAAIVWGKVVKWISKDEEYLMLKSTYYDEDDILVKTEYGKEIKDIGGRKLPTRIEIIPAEKDNQKTILITNEIEFNIPIKSGFFSQQQMKRLRK
ncbi:outer membrane lipoprotein-sorting protein [Aquimarina hainanensis]|uniref:Outer membrane lipoprotein-sorting protein n=1 Tax=Aquimarina hainanensis TaxID=1578017 RepID=A0ABW5N913_9FLAO|nr:outer membrane lipoprotein-sorting protein [Aquimarina sp. TRL1]QKX05483.1 outer membrane lipoprotein-sorting protein [Aquimarina sp. TRL1]